MSKKTKKIRVTEGQLRMITLLEDNSGAVDSVINKAKRMEAVVDGLWNKVTFLGINDILDQKDALESYIEDMYKLDSAASSLGDEKESILNKVGFDDAMSEFDVFVDGLVNNIHAKTDLLRSIISHMLEIDKVMAGSRGRFPDPIEVR